MLNLFIQIGQSINRNRFFEKHESLVKVYVVNHIYFHGFIFNYYSIYSEAELFGTFRAFTPYMQQVVTATNSQEMIVVLTSIIELIIQVLSLNMVR